MMVCLLPIVVLGFTIVGFAAVRRGRPASGKPRPEGRLHLAGLTWVVLAASLGMALPAHAQETADRIARLADNQLSSKEARSIAQALDRAPSLTSLTREQVETLLASLIGARSRFRYDKGTAKSLDSLALDILRDRDPKGHILGKNLIQIIENPNYLRREESFRAALQFLLDAQIQPSEFFDALKILDTDQLEDRDLIKRNADLTRKLSAPGPYRTQPVSPNLADSVSALSGPWPQMTEDQIVQYVKILGGVLGSSPVGSGVDYATALEFVSRKQVLSAIAQKVPAWLEQGDYQAIIAFAACIDALVISEIAQDVSSQLKSITEDQLVKSFFTLVLASARTGDLISKEACEKAADDLFRQNPLAITVRVMRIAQEQAAALVQDLRRQSLLAELYRYYQYQAQLLEMKAAQPLQLAAYVYQDPLSPAKVGKKLQTFAGLNPDDSMRLSPAIVSLQTYLRTGRIPDDSDFRRYVLVEAAKSIPHLLLISLLDRRLDEIGEWMLRPDLTADEAKVFATWMFFAPLQGDRLEKAYSYLLIAGSNFKEMDPAAVALGLATADLLKRQDQDGAVLADYLARVLKTRSEEPSLRQVRDILYTFHGARYFPIAARTLVRDIEFQDPEIRALRRLMVDDRFPNSPPPADPSTQAHGAPPSP